MHIAIAAITMGAGSTLEITDHRESHACITGEILPEAKPRGRDPLVTILDLLQLGRLRPEPVHAGCESLDAMSVQIELDERCPGEISKKWPACRSKDRRELRQRHR